MYISMRLMGCIGAKGNAADGGMLANSIDLSFVGISGIWNNDIGNSLANKENSPI